jgi:Sulfate permease family
MPTAFVSCVSFFCRVNGENNKQTNKPLVSDFELPELCLFKFQQLVICLHQTGVLVLVALEWMTPLFYHIPKASLAVVVIMAVVDMITFHKVLLFWRTKSEYLWRI